MDRFLIVKAGKKELQEVFADRSEGALGRKVRPVDIVHSAADSVRSENLLGDVVQVLVHRPVEHSASGFQGSTSNDQASGAAADVWMSDLPLQCLLKLPACSAVSGSP